MKILKEKSSLLLLILAVFISTLIQFKLGNFVKATETYGDELLYIDIAKSIFNGDGITVRGADFNFQKILYCLCIAPLFIIKDSIFRVKLITLVNSLLMSLSIVPAWLIGKELELKKTYRWAMVVFVAFWPDLLTSGTFMSEIVFWPVLLFAFWTFIKSEKSGSVLFAGIAGVISYFTYLSKEVGLCLPVAICCYYVADLFFYLFSKSDKKMRQYLLEKIKRMAVYIIAFAGCFAIFKFIVFPFCFGGSANTYALGSASGYDWYKILYLFYGLIYYLIATVVAFLIVPVLYPLAAIRVLDRFTKQVYLFAIIFTGVSCAVVDYMLVNSSDLGLAYPHIMIRYYAPVVVLFWGVFLKSVQEVQLVKSKMILINALILVGMAGAFIICMFKGTDVSCISEHFSLRVYDVLKDIYPVKGMETAHPIYIHAILISGILLIVSLIAILLIHSKKKIALAIAFCMAICVCYVNDVYSHRFIVGGMSVDPSSVVEMSNINDYFKENDIQDSCVLYIQEWTYGKETKIFDTYFDGSNICVINGSDICTILSQDDDGVVNVSDIEFNEYHYGTQYDLESFDYIIVYQYATELPALTNLEEISELTGNVYSVYKNLNPTQLQIEVSR